MIVYKIDKPVQATANTQIRDMGVVLSEIAPTLRMLNDLLAEHQSSLSTQHINQYREELQRLIAEAIRLTHVIAVNSQRLTSVSDQTAKQLVILDDQIVGALQGRATVNSSAQKSTTTTDNSVETQRTTTRALSFSKNLSRV